MKNMKSAARSQEKSSLTFIENTRFKSISQLATKKMVDSTRNAVFGNKGSLTNEHAKNKRENSLNKN